MLNNRIGFIGAGNMASAIINGSLSANFTDAANISIFDSDVNKCVFFSEKGCDICQSCAEVSLKSDILIIAVKPQNIAVVLDEISNHLKPGGVLVSIAAGVSIDKINGFIGNYPIIRIMPNACMMVSLGASAISCSENVTAEQLSSVRALFSCCGVTETIDETLQNSVISIHGSSPAYIFLFAKAVVDEAEAEGIDPSSALNLICQTLCGSAEMMKTSDKSIDELISIITSKGGTTEAALKVLNERGFYDAVRDAMKACRDRAEALGKG